ncbi:MAG TPA: hypothetical protein PLO78_07150 [Candidatus Omnitrophota bacterium]|nr:hypothetical protein [Candidatus Omnitrophota bacterium]
MLASEKKSEGFPSKPSKISSREVSPGAFSKNLKYLFRSLIFLGIVFGVAVLGYQAYPLIFSSKKNVKPISIQVSGREGKSGKISAKEIPLSLSVQEKEILNQEAVVALDRVPEPAEQEILNRTVQFQTGWVESLPSVTWTLSQYQKMIQEQEHLYKMPFSRSYKGKLEDLFTKKYLGAADVFAKGDVLAARNLWVESLIFPPYSTDLRKHRAIALTMLRPFINDTLAKIRAMNQSLSEKEQRAEEQTLTGAYQNLAGLIGQKKWDDAIAAIDQLVPLVAELQKKSKLPHPPPPYPASFGMIDQDLQRPLMDLMTANPSSMANLQPLQQDLVEKKEILETFTEGYVKHVMENYRKAMELIRQEKWQEAINVLESIQGPRVLQEDAARKAAILKKMALR